MRSPGQLPEHIDRLCLIVRFSKYFSVDYNGRVGGEHSELLAGMLYGQRLFTRESDDIGPWCLPRHSGLINIRHRNDVRYANLGQQLASSRRSRSKTQYGSHQSR
jgi:hypothetical protein